MTLFHLACIRHLHIYQNIEGRLQSVPSPDRVILHDLTGQAPKKSAIGLDLAHGLHGSDAPVCHVFILEIIAQEVPKTVQNYEYYYCNA